MTFTKDIVSEKCEGRVKIAVSLDSFKGCITSQEACKTVANAIAKVYPMWEVKCFAVADGGEGTAEILATATKSKRIFCDSIDPLGRGIRSCYYYNEDTETGYADTAQCSGLSLLNADETDANRTSTFGTGILLNEMVKRGAKKIVLGLGGSATVDAGAGALQALGVEYYRCDNTLISNIITGGNLGEVSFIRIPQELVMNWAQTEIILLSDVTTPLCGINGAAAIFGPQKGLKPDEIEKFDKMLLSFAKIVGHDDMVDKPFTGAAGGFGFGLKSILNARFENGAEFVCKQIGLTDAIKESQLLITGEGKADRQSLMGKITGYLLSIAKKENVPVILLAGAVEDKEYLLEKGFKIVSNINEVPMKTERKLLNPLDSGLAKSRLETTVMGLMQNIIG